MAAIFAAKGFSTTGCDLNPVAVAAMAGGRAPVHEPGLQETIDRGRARLRATQDATEAVRQSEISFVIVPTPSGPDGLFSNAYVIDCVRTIGEALKTKDGYHLVVVTSTVMPGSTGGEIRVVLEAASGRLVGEDTGLCYHPEFVALGSVLHDMLHPDMILIGESDPRAGDMLEAVSLSAVDNTPRVHRMNLVNAELTKIAVNTFVSTKISFANMIAELCDFLPCADADVVTAALGADSRIGHKYLKSAIGYGGPCFPRDNKALAALGRRLGANPALAEATDLINDHQVQRLRGAVEARAAPGATVAVLGMAYKPGTGVVEASQGVMLASVLAGDGYQVLIADPQASAAGAAALGGRVEALSADEAARRADVIVVTTPWPEFAAIPPDVFRRFVGRATVIDPWRLLDSERVGMVADLVHLGSGNSGVAANANRVYVRADPTSSHPDGVEKCESVLLP
jgi:UDPglucose 6-dehydrogenase